MEKDKGVAGLTILLSVIALVFVIGFLVMIFALMGGELATVNLDTITASITAVNTTAVCNSSASCNPIGVTTTLPSCSLTVTTMTNTTDTIPASNYTVSGCEITAVMGVNPFWNNTYWNITGAWTYLQDTEASDTINDTVAGIANVTDWFPIIIVITVMVVLILLTVIIITAIRSSGLLQAGGTS